MSTTQDIVQPELDRETRKALIKARKKIQRWGWVQGQFGDRIAGYCIVGAVRSASKNSRVRNKACDALYTCLIGRRRKVGYSDSALFSWNDRYGRQKSHVVDLINKTLEGQCTGESNTNNRDKVPSSI